LKTIILGFDAFDPGFCENLFQKGSLPNLARYLGFDGYRRFKVTDPPQSEVSWTSIATGLDPGGHGIFDFVHRDPGTYTPFVSLLPTKRTVGGIRYAPPTSASTIFDQAAKMGYPATSLFWPATFPARPDSTVKSLPGLGTPDIHGKLGVGIQFSSGNGVNDENRKTPLELLHSRKNNIFQGELIGPSQKKRGKEQTTLLPFEVEKIDEQHAQLRILHHAIDLKVGEWSPIFGFSFRMSTFVKLHVLTRVILTSFTPEISLYFLPLQIHPLHSPWHYGVPPKFVKNTWSEDGPFLTIGWPQDTTGLEDGCINDEQFLKLCEDIFDTRVQILLHQIENYQEGLIAAVFDSLDRIQHMFWRERPDIVESWYRKLDNLVGQVEQAIKKKGIEHVRILIVSDHGFVDFEQKVHLNRWLIEKGFLIADAEQGAGGLKNVDWQASQAYGLGLNSIYLNLAGREGEGIVYANQVDPLINRIKDELLTWHDNDGTKVVERVLLNKEAFSGPMGEYGPDLVVGYAPGFRASQQTGLGQWGGNSLEVNRAHWNADHCIDSESVPGVLFSNDGLADYTEPSYRDIPWLAIGKRIDGDSAAPPITSSEEDREVIEDRLRSLGYL